MSSRKRRIKRKIKMLARMDATYYYKANRRRQKDERLAVLTAAMQALGRKLTRMGHDKRGIAYLNIGRAERSQHRP